MALDPAVTSRLVILTPTDAQTLLTKVLATGKADQKLVRTYADDMRAGQWLTNGASIVLSPTGEVLDGRTRLLACVQAQTPFETLIVEGIPAEAFETIDAVRKRTLADVLHIRSYHHGRALGAGLRVIWAYLTGSIVNGRSPSSIRLLELIESHPEIKDSAKASQRASPLLPHGAGIALHYLFGLVHPEKCDSFFRQLSEEALAAPDTPVGHLRRVLTELKLRGGKRKPVYVLAVAIKAWNAFYGGKSVKLLRYDPEREPFPTIAGFRGQESKSPPIGPLFDEAKPSRPSTAGISAQLEEIGPELAEQLLANNSMNRSIAGSIVEKYARDMREGRWRLNGQTIKISADGRLLDGQHRLEAVKKAERPFKAIVVRGVSVSTFGSLDTGRRRALNEILRDREEVNTTVLASALRWLWMLRHEVILAANTSPTNGEMLDILEENPAIRDSIKFTALARDLISGGMSAALHHEFRKIDIDCADEFFSRLIDGVNLDMENPVYLLRERLLKNKKSYRLRMAENERVAITMKAWVKFKEGSSMRQLAWRNRGSAREGLPPI